jgi:hypothetical protein
MDEEQTATIGSRADFAQWAIERARVIVSDQGAALALAARDGNEDALRSTGSALGAAISEALMEVFDAVVGDD